MNWFNKDLIFNYPQGIAVSLLRAMIRIRIVEEEVARRYPENEMKTPIHLCIGQEAVSVGVCHALKTTDYVYCGHRTHGVYLAKGGDLKAMLCEFYGKLNGCAGSRGGSMHLLDPKVGMMGSSAICAGAIPIAVGSALRAKLNGENQVTAVFFGDGAAEEGALWESINFAVVKKLPVLFVCENNFYSVQSPLGPRQPANTRLSSKASSFGAHVMELDGMSVVEMFNFANHAINLTRQGVPHFIEAKTYRYLAHGGHLDDTQSGYRRQTEVDHYKKQDPIQEYYTFLLGHKMITEAECEAMRNEIKEEVAQAFHYAISSPYPKESDLYGMG